jgi:adenosylhomocysteine nucleosidase
MARTVAVKVYAEGLTLDGTPYSRNFARNVTAAQEPSTLLIFYAFARELAHFRRRLEARSALEVEGLHGLHGRLGEADLTLIATGMGTTRARETARRALEAFPGTKLVISAGVAGALSEGLRPGDLVVADRLMLGGRESSSAAHILPLDPGQVRAAEQALRAAGLRFATGAMLTAGRVLADGAAKRVAKEQSGAIAVDMESAVLGLEAAAHGMPFVCVRAVLDAIDDEIPAAELGGADGQVRPLAAASFLVRHPATLLKLPRLMRNLSRATASLADALDALARHRTPR